MDARAYTLARLIIHSYSNEFCLSIRLSEFDFFMRRCPSIAILWKIYGDNARPKAGL